MSQVINQLEYTETVLI